MGIGKWLGARRQVRVVAVAAAGMSAVTLAPLSAGAAPSDANELLNTVPARYVRWANEVCDGYRLVGNGAIKRLGDDRVYGRVRAYENDQGDPCSVNVPTLHTEGESRARSLAYIQDSGDVVKKLSKQSTGKVGPLRAGAADDITIVKGVIRFANGNHAIGKVVL